VAAFPTAVQFVPGLLLVALPPVGITNPLSSSNVSVAVVGLITLGLLFLKIVLLMLEKDQRK
jgi:hypothetical protein